MKWPRLEQVDPSTLRFIALPPFFADCLLRLGEILSQRNHPDIARRLFPAPSDDEPFNAEWRVMIAPELRHLFVEAGEMVLGDLAALEPEGHWAHTFRVVFPAAHADAWMSALNEARLILGEQFGLREEDLDHPMSKFNPNNARHMAIARVWALGYLLELLVGGADAGARPENGPCL